MNGAVPWHAAAALALLACSGCAAHMADHAGIPLGDGTRHREARIEPVGAPSGDVTGFRVKAALYQHIQARDSVLEVEDPATGEGLHVEFIETYPTVFRTAEGEFLASAAFRDPSSQSDVPYLLDFRLQQQGQELVVVLQRVRAYPRRTEEGGWILEERYPIRGDEVP